MIEKNRLGVEVLHLAGLGYRVFPCVPGGKVPLAEAVPNGRNGATDDEETLLEWLGKYPTANWGLVTDDLLVVDIDGADNRWPEDQAKAESLLACGAMAITGISSSLANSFSERENSETDTPPNSPGRVIHSPGEPGHPLDHLHLRTHSPWAVPIPLDPSARFVSRAAAGSSPAIPGGAARRRRAAHDAAFFRRREVTRRAKSTKPERYHRWPREAIAVASGRVRP